MSNQNQTQATTATTEAPAQQTIPFYRILKHIIDISQYGNITKELNIISYQGRPGKLDLRQWQTAEDGTRKMLKGITLNEQEAQNLKMALNHILPDISAMD